MESLDFQLSLGKGWEIAPAGGATGAAYIAQNEGEKLFLKRNSSPFLAVLSAEGIVPKLVWTKRMENGDVITAQHWLDGRELKAKDMSSPSVAKLLSKIHHSQALTDMLKRISKIPLSPLLLVEEIYHMEQTLPNHETVHQALRFIEKKMNEVDVEHKVVCHGDINHNNWLLSKENVLYLIDWDGARIADPALDLGTLLYSYIPFEDWQQWLSLYGVELTDHLRKRLKWYTVAQALLSISWHNSRLHDKELNNRMSFLQKIL